MADFLSAAREFTALVASFDPHSRTAFGHALHLLLPRVYSTALLLPGAPEQHFEDRDAESDAEEVMERALGRDAKRDLLDRLSRFMGPSWDKYRDVSDAYDTPSTEPNYGWLSDDLTDSYGDLTEGLAMWDRGYRGHAVWHWKFGFERHWGQHVLGALTAIRTLSELYDLGYPPQRARAG